MADDPRLNAYRGLAEHPDIFEAIAATTGDEFHVQKVLRSRYPDEVVRLALSISELRSRAAKKFPQAGSMWFDRERLEQATPWAVAQHKAKRFEGEIWDYCCGAGSDALALAEHGHVTAVDADPVACLLTEWNATTFGLRDRIDVRCADVAELAERSGLLHIDPDRRAGSAGRAVRVEDYVPGLETIRQLMEEFRGGAVKLSPAANFGGKFDDVEIELVSLNGEAKEATIWFGELAGRDEWRATVLPQDATIAGDPLSVAPVHSELNQYLYDPDPAVVRAGLLDLLCSQTGLARLDEAEEYLAAAEFIETPFAHAFRVIADLPNNERAIRKFLREANAGRLEIKARRIRIDVPRLHRTLPSEGERPLVLVFARIAGKARAIVCEREQIG